MQKLLTIERALRSPLNWSQGVGGAMEHLQVKAKDENFYLDLIDAILFELATPIEADDLEATLQHGGSAWRVVNVTGPKHFQFGIERRVEAAIADAAREVMSSTGKAGEHLQLAWRATYRRNPNPTEAYWESVRAVEAAGKPIVSPSNPTTTLGTMVNDLAAAPNKWNMTLHPKGGVDPIETLTAMMRLLWKSHTDRHGTPDESIEVSQAEAVAALHLAITLVHWFAAGSVVRSSSR